MSDSLKISEFPIADTTSGLELAGIKGGLNARATMALLRRALSPTVEQAEEYAATLLGSVQALSGSYATKSAADAAAVSLAEGRTVDITSDPTAALNGIWVKRGGVLVQISTMTVAAIKAALDGVTGSFAAGAPRMQDGLEIWGEHVISGFGILDWGPAHFRGGGIFARRGLDGSFSLSDPTGPVIARSADGTLTYTGLPVETVDVPGVDLVLAGTGGTGMAFAVNRSGYLQLAGYPEATSGSVNAGDFTATEYAALAAEAAEYTSKVRRKAVTLHQPTEGLVLWAGYGQSFLEAVEAWPAITRTAAPDCYMFGQSVRPASRTATSFAPTGGSAALQPHVATVSDGAGGVLNDAQVAALPFGADNPGESYLEGFMAVFRPAWLRSRGKVSDPSNRFVVANCAVGGKSIAQLSSGASPNYFNRLSTAIDLGIAQAAADGVTFGVGGVLMDQGQQDYNEGTSFADYVTQFTQWVADVRTLVVSKVPAQTGLLPIYIVQTGGQYANDTQKLQVARAQIEIARTVPGVFLVAGAQHVTDKGDHLTANSSRWMGCTLGRAAVRTIIEGVGVECTRAIRWTWRGKTLVGVLHVPEGQAKAFAPYVGRVVSSAAAAPARGLYVTAGGAMVPVSDVRFESERLVVATLSDEPQVAPEVWLGRWSGNAGAVCISDSDRTPLVLPYAYLAGFGQTVDEDIPALNGLTFPSENVCLADVQTATAA